jgi:hypothetical protein
MAAPGSKKPEAHTLEYVEDFLSEHEADAGRSCGAVEWQRIGF